MKAAIIGPNKMSDSLLKWVTLTVERVQRYGWTLFIPDEPGVSQLCALVADARGLDYTVVTLTKDPRIISYAGNYQFGGSIYNKPSRIEYLYETVLAVNIVIALPGTTEKRNIEWWARDNNALLISL